MYTPRVILRHIGSHVRSSFSAGLVVALPLAVTVLIFQVIVDWFDPLLQPFFEFLLGEGVYRQGMGIGALIVLLYLIGLLTTHTVGRKAIDLGHRAMQVVPVVRSVYGTLLQATEVLSNTGHTLSPDKYRGVVLVDFPKEGSKAVGLVTAWVDGPDGRPSATVFVPTTPIPSSGYLLIVSREDMIPVDVSIDEAMKFVISGGLITPEKILQPRSYLVMDKERSNQ